MFTLEDGREQLYQWDLDRRIIVTDVNICEVHFCNRTSDCSLVVEVYTENNTMYANIPNILLQDARPIRAYAYCDDKYTLTEQQFSVKSRTKPSDYVYEETTVIRIDVLLDRAEEAVNLAEQSAQHADKTAKDLYDYIDTHTLDFTDDGKGNVTLEAIIPEGGEVNLDNYYTKLETEALIDEAVADIAQVDLTGYAKLEDIPTIPENVSSFNNDAGYLTEHQSLDGYAKLTDIPTNYLTEVPSEYITETELNDKGYLTEHQSLTNYYTKEQTNAAIEDAIDGIDIPTTDLSSYATKAYVDEADTKHTQDIANLTFHVQNIIEPTITGKADKSHKHTISDITDYTAPDLTGYATEQYVDDAIANIPSGGGGEGGSEVKVLRLYNNSSKYTDEDKAAIWEYISNFVNNDRVPPDDTIIYVQSMRANTEWLPATKMNATISTYGTYLDVIGIDADGKECHRCVVYYNADGSYQRMQISMFDLVPPAGSWERYTGSNVGGDIYSYTEMFICAYNNSSNKYLTSYVVFDGVLGNSTYTLYPFSGDSNIGWEFDGWNINTNDSSVEIRHYAVKSS